MSHDVFISHSSLDKLQADAICHGLEAKGIRCWIAPRDQIAGKPYGEQITEAIETADVMVLVFSENVNRSQAVLNEINIAAGSDVTIVPFRIASVEFNSELHFYLGRMHWLDAFPQPIDAYIDTLATTVRRNLRHTPPPDPAAAAAAAEEIAEEATVVLASTGVAAATAATIEPPPRPPPPQPPPQATTITPPQQTNNLPLLITGGVFGLVVLIAIVVSMTQKPPTPAPTPFGQPTPFGNTIANAAPAPQGEGMQPLTGNGSELTPVNAGNAAGVNYYETELTATGPPAQLQGATVITTAQLIAAMRNRDAGTNPFWLIDARGCSTEPTIPTSVCLTDNNIGSLQAKIPDRSTQIVIFCHDGSCPTSYEMASQAVAAGYTNIFWYRGGINAWMAAGEPSVNQGVAIS